MKKIYNGHILPKKVILNHLFRQKTVFNILKKYKPASVLDIGSGEGEFIELIKKEKYIKNIIGIEVDRGYFKESKKVIKTISDNKKIILKNISLFELPKSFIKKYQGVDAATMIEVIEHFFPKELPLVSKILFKDIQPKLIILTTPNAVIRNTDEELNRIDHKFEWDVPECLEWGNKIAQKYNYRFTHQIVKRKSKDVKRGSQMCIFEKIEK